MVVILSKCKVGVLAEVTRECSSGAYRPHGGIGAAIGHVKKRALGSSRPTKAIDSDEDTWCWRERCRERKYIHVYIKHEQSQTHTPRAAPSFNPTSPANPPAHSTRGQTAATGRLASKRSASAFDPGTCSSQLPRYTLIARWLGRSLSNRRRARRASNQGHFPTGTRHCPFAKEKG